MNLRLTKPLVMFVLALFAILVFAMPGLAANWYVSPTGTDAGGTTCQNSGSPCKKIQTVINNALVLTGDTIRVRDNGDDPAPDYTENITIPAGKEITITAYPVNANDTPARVMALHDDESVFTIKANNVTIQGLEIYGATDTLVDVAAIEVDSGVSGAVIKKNKCGFGPGYKNKYGILLSGTGGGNNIESNTCNYNTDIGIFINAGSSGNMIQNNTCNFNTNAGIAARNSADSNAYQNNIASHNISTGIDIANSTKNDISGNTVEDNAEYGISLGTDAVMNTVSGNKVRYNDQGTYGYGITIIGAHHNMVSQNEVTGNKIGIYLYGDTAQYNTFAGNTVSSNKETGIYADSVNPTANNWFYYNFLYANYDDLDFQANAAGNHFTTPTIAPWGYWFDTGDTRSSALGNYHSTYGGTDANGDGIGDSNHTEPNVVDSKPMMYKSDRYDLQTWFASGNRMYKGDQSKPGEIVALNDGVAVYFTADVKAAQDVVFNGGQRLVRPVLAHREYGGRWQHRNIRSDQFHHWICLGSGQPGG